MPNKIDVNFHAKEDATKEELCDEPLGEPDYDYE